MSSTFENWEKMSTRCPFFLQCVMILSRMIILPEN